MSDIREKVAHAMWLEQAKRAGTPSVIAGRTPIAFANTAEQTRREWLGYADAALAVVPAPAVPDDVAVEILTRTAARADAAEAENKRLREALQDIMADRPSEKHNGNRNDLIAWQMWRRARAALSQPTGEGSA